MPRKRERTTTKASWTVETLENAVKKLRRGGSSVYKVSKETAIPYSTLKKRFRLAKLNNDSYKCPPKLGRPSVFTKEQEAILAEHLRKMSNKFYGLTRAQFCKICYAMAEKFNVADRFNEVKKSAGRDFVAGFFQRNPDLSFRKPESTSINRILGFNKVEVDRFFDNLENVMTKHHFPPSQIYNMDETGVTTVQETERIIAPKGQKRVGTITSWERGKNVTVICAMSASGSFIPPLFIFPRQRHSPQLEKDGPPGAAYTCSHNGWTNESIYIKWLRHFITHSKPTAEQPVLLILDNHNSHCTLEAWEVAKANNVIMLSLPPHSSHRLQPLDVTFFGPLKRAYNKECDIFMKSRNMVKITPYEIAGLFNKAYARVASLDKGISGFKATGIFPMNPAIFSEDDFVAEEQNQNQSNMQTNLATVALSQRHISQQLVTGKSDPLPSTSRDTGDPETFPSTSRGIQQDSFALILTPNIQQEEIPDIDRDGSPSILNDSQLEAYTANITPKLFHDKACLDPASANLATTSFITNNIQEQLLYTDPTISNDAQQQSNILQATSDNFDAQTSTCPITAEILDFAKVLSAVSPLPNISNKNQISRQKQHSVILSSTPMKAVFEEKENKRLEKNIKTKINLKKKGQTSNKERKCTAKKINKRKKTINIKENVKRVQKILFDDDTDTSEAENIENLCDDESEYSEEDILCSICCDTGKDNEMWYRCRGCGKWAHKECSGSDSPVAYICVFCLDP